MFEVYHRGKFIIALGSKKSADTYVAQRRSVESPDERKFWEIRPESPFRVVDRSGRVVAGFGTRHEAEAMRKERSRRSPGAQLRIVGKLMG